MHLTVFFPSVSSSLRGLSFEICQRKLLTYFSSTPCMLHVSRIYLSLIGPLDTFCGNGAVTCHFFCLSYTHFPQQPVLIITAVFMENQVLWDVSPRRLVNTSGYDVSEEFASIFMVKQWKDCWRIKDQLDVTCYFISLLMCWTYFGH